MLQRIVDWLVIPNKSEEEKAANRRWLQAMIIAALAFLWLYSLFSGGDQRVFLFTAGFSGVLIALFFLLRTGRTNTVAILFSLSCVVGMLYAAYHFGGLRSSSYFGMVVALVIAATFMRGTVTALLTILVILFGGLLALAEASGGYIPDESHTGILETWVGTSLTFVVTATLVSIASQTVRILFRNEQLEIQGRHKVEQALQEQAHYLTALHETALSIINRLELLPLLDSMLSRARELVETEHGYIDLLLPGASGVMQMVGHGVFAQLGNTIVPPERGVTALVLQTRETQVVYDYPSWPQNVPEYAQVGFQAIVAVPMKLRGEVTGIIGLAHTDPKRRFSDVQIKILERFAELASLALDNARLYQAAQDELKERKRTQEALARSEENLRLALDAARMGTWNWDIITNQVTWSDTVYDLFDIKKEDLTLTYQSYLDFIYPDDRENVETAIRRSLENPELFYYVVHRIKRHEGTIRWMEGQGRVYTDQDARPIRMAGTVTDITDRKQAEETLRQANQQLESDTLMLERRSALLQVGAEVSRAATAILDPGELSQQVVEFVQKRFELYYVGLFLVDEKGEFAVLRAATGKAGREMLKHRHRLMIGNTSMVGWCIANRRARIALDVGEDAVRFNNPLLPKTRSELALPLISRGQALGALTIQSETEAAFSGEDIDTLQTMADQLANVILNARFYDQLEKELEVRKQAEEEVRKLNTELEERVRQRTADLKASEETFRALTENNPLRIRRYDRDGHYLYANAVGTTPDLDPANVIGKTIREVIEDPGLVELAERCIRQVFDTGKPMNTEYKIGDSYASWWLAPEFGPDGKVVSVVTSTMDITERRHTEDELRLRSLELQATVKELEAFSYSVSHDLRAPLRALDGFSRILLEDFRENLPQEAQRFLNRIREASIQMAHLIDDMLRLSRITRTEMHSSPIDLTEMALTIMDELRAREPQRTVEIHVQDRLTARGDERLMHVALENLLSNAWKFSSKNENATIEVGKKKVQGKNVFFVRDNGVGFDMAYADKLFGTFQRLHSGEEFPGTGIGLAIVQRVIHKHGGQVWAESRPGKGATFYFTL